jgi:hypothetical protein
MVLSIELFDYFDRLNGFLRNTARTLEDLLFVL